MQYFLQELDFLMEPKISMAQVLIWEKVCEILLRKIEE